MQLVVLVTVKTESIFFEIGQEAIAEKDLWISAKMGIFAISEPKVRMGGYADFEWFRITK